MISQYLLSIVGISFLGVLVEIILPNGTMNKFVKGIFGLFVIFSVVVPLSNLPNISSKLDSLVKNSESVRIDEDFLQATSKQVIIQKQNILEAKLTDAGFLNVDVEISYNLYNYEISIKSVTLNLKKLVINNKIPHINKYTEMKKVVVDYLNVKEEIVIFNEWTKRE